jgi:phospholipase A-2-activating protein
LTKVGSATSAGGSATNRKRTVYEDKEYDFVFDIQLDDEGQTLKLPYNLSEDPWFAAQKFIHKYELNQIFLDQIAQFIINNTKGETIMAQSSAYVDPFTGASKYTPGNKGEANTGGPTNYDPFTGGARYVPPMNPSTNTRAQARVVADPFTGDNAYHTNGSGPSRPDVSAKSTPATNPYYPQAGFVLFDQKNIPSILNKIKEFQQVNKTTETTSQLIEKLANMDTIDLNQKIETLFHLINSWTTGMWLKTVHSKLNSNHLKKTQFFDLIKKKLYSRCSISHVSLYQPKKSKHTFVRTSMKMCCMSRWNCKSMEMPW